MRVESGERRAYLPAYIGRLEKRGADIKLAFDYGAKMGFRTEDYLNAAPNASFVSNQEAYKQDYVFVLRCPDEEDLRLLRPGACLVSMLHYPTRPKRTKFIRLLGVEAVSLDSLVDDNGLRLVENLRAVAWNGIEVAFETLRQIYPAPGFKSPNRPPLKVTAMGSGGVGIHVPPAAIRYGNPGLWHEMITLGVPGVQVTVIDYDTTKFDTIMFELLKQSDILVDATQRRDPSKAVIPNEWIKVMPQHAVLVDLSVDPYEPPEVVKGIEGVPNGNLDQYVFTPNDPIYNTIPADINRCHRRHAVSCYSWPGIHPKECMKVYGKQLAPIFRTLIDKGGTQNIDPNGDYYERAISRALLSRLPS
jgi:alanine dehydrogenase